MELRALPREQWEAHGVQELGPRLPGRYAVFFGQDGIAWVVPEPDGRFRVDGRGSQQVLAEFQRQVDEGEAEEDEDEAEEGAGG